jgi:(S)-ureidoglycine-glyoxylate aminotransferase
MLGVADLAVPQRLFAAGRLSQPDPRVQRALGMPLIGQFDPAFTRIMDEVVQLARRVLPWPSGPCVPVSGLAEAGLEALLNSVLETGDEVLVAGSETFCREVRRVALGYGAHVDTLISERVDTRALARRLPPLVVVSHVDPETSLVLPLADLAQACHARGATLVVEASLSLGGCELRADAWGLDAITAGVDGCLGAPSGLALVAYSDALEARMRARRAQPRTSYLDLLQLQAYWSAERLNHHTAPTSLIYGLREALRLVLDEGLQARWRRHERVGEALAAGLAALGFGFAGNHDPGSTGAAGGEERAPTLWVVDLPHGLPADAARRRLLDDYGVYVGRGADGRWRVGLVGADAQAEAVLRLLAGLEQVLLAFGCQVRPGAARTAALSILEPT